MRVYLDTERAESVAVLLQQYFFLQSTAVMVLTKFGSRYIEVVTIGEGEGSLVIQPSLPKGRVFFFCPLYLLVPSTSQFP